MEKVLNEIFESMAKDNFAKWQEILANNSKIVDELVKFAKNIKEDTYNICLNDVIGWVRLGIEAGLSLNEIKLYLVYYTA